MPERFGYRALLLLAAFAGLSGGQLCVFTPDNLLAPFRLIRPCRANMAVASAYLGDVAGTASKAQLLSSYEAALFAGLGLGPLLGTLQRSFLLGLRPDPA